MQCGSIKSNKYHFLLKDSELYMPMNDFVDNVLFIHDIN